MRSANDKQARPADRLQARTEAPHAGAERLAPSHTNRHRAPHGTLPAAPLIRVELQRRLQRRRSQTDSLSSLAGRKAIFLLALILMASPVAGLRPMRAGRLRTWKMPSAGMRILSPFFRCFASRSTRPV